MADSRSYDSTYRKAQSERTRLVILDALAELVADDGFEGIVVDDLAQRAGVSARTIYRHFPDRDALHDGLAAHLAELSHWGDTTLGPVTGWGELIQDAHESFDREAVIATVAAKLNAVRARTSAESAARRNSFVNQVAEELPHLSEEEVEAVVAVLLIHASSRTWLRLKEELGMDGAQSGPLMRYVIELVVADIEERRGLPDYVTDSLATANQSSSA